MRISSRAFFARKGARRIGTTALVAALALVEPVVPASRAQDADPGPAKQPPALESLDPAVRPQPTESARDRVDGEAPVTAAERAVRDPAIEALAHPLDATERAELVRLARELGAPDLRARDAAAERIRVRFGCRAAGTLLALSRREPDPERRFRERALVASLVELGYLATAHDCGWLGVRWQMSRTPHTFFSVLVVEPLAHEPAALGGLQKDDQIVTWDGVALEGQDDFVDRVQTAAPGSTIVLGVERPRSVGPGKLEWHRLDLRVVVGRRADAPDSADLAWLHRDLAARRFTRWLEAWKKTGER